MKQMQLQMLQIILQITLTTLSETTNDVESLIDLIMWCTSITFSFYMLLFIGVKVISIVFSVSYGLHGCSAINHNLGI